MDANGSIKAYIEREFDLLRSTGCGSGDGQMVDFMRIIDKKMDL